MKIAKQAGIVTCDVTYERHLKSYAIRITVPLKQGKGFTDAAVGVYTSPEEAATRIDDDLLAFLDKEPAAWDKVSLSYDDVMQERQRAALALGWEMLQAIAEGNLHLLKQEHRAAATAILDEVARLQAHSPALARKAKGTYKSRLPNQPKKPIEWEQPDSRQHPVYVFEITCPYCGTHATLERHSPREPRHCGAQACEEEHTRILARERKRRQRLRRKKE